MSYIITNLCRPLPMKPTPKCVLMALADRACDEGNAWPSITWICEWTCFGRDAVIDAIAWLEGAGVVVADRENGRQTKYRLTPSNFDPEFSQPSRRALTRAATSRAEPPVPVGQNHRSGKTTGRAEPATSRAEPPHQSGKTTGPVGQPDTIHKEPSFIHKEDTHRARRPKDLVELLEGFTVFYAAYPKKKARPKAYEAWQRLNPDAALRAQILAAVALQRRTDDWRKEGGKYIPYPASYLNGRRWEDDVPGAAPVGQTDWLHAAGFTHIAEAQNARCHIGNYREFRDGKRIASEVSA